MILHFLTVQVCPNSVQCVCSKTGPFKKLEVNGSVFVAHKQIVWGLLLAVDRDKHSSLSLLHNPFTQIFVSLLVVNVSC